MNLRFASGPPCSTYIKSLAVGLLTLTPAFSPPMLHAIGFRNPSQDSLATARGDAFVATADNPSAVYYNPAAMTHLNGTQTSAGAYLITVRTRYEAPDGEVTRNRHQVHAIPHLYVTHKPANSPFAFGLGVVTPFGLSNEWPDDVRFREKAIEGSITYVSVLPTIAYQINSQLSIGGGLTLNYGEAELVQGTVPGERSRFRGDDTTVGYHLGIFWTPHRKHAFGLNFRGPDDLSLNGSSDVQPSPPFPGREDASANLSIPEYLTVGYSYRPTAQWNLEANVDWTNWDRLDNMTLTTASFAQDVRFNWQSSFMYQVGATRYLAAGYRISAGYLFSENSVPDADFSPLTADADRHFATFGLGRSYHRITWDVSAQIGHSPTRRVPDSEDPANGEYSTNTFAAAFTLGYSW